MGKMNFNAGEINNKHAMLETIRNVLKTEFLGIDNVIDKVVDSLTSWVLFPELQERPVIINLWGMTGVGKTALVVRLAELLEYEKKLFRYDMGNSSNNNSGLQGILEDLFHNQNGLPAMIMLDEFQYAKTKNEDNNETDNRFSRVIWDLLDSGKFQSVQSHIHLNTLTEIQELLKVSLDHGVIVKRGLVRTNLAVFKDIMTQKNGHHNFTNVEYDHKITTGKKTLFQFIPKSIITDLYYSFNKQTSIISFRQDLLQMNGPETIQLINKAIENARSNKWVDCSKTAIFILGNLDEAYTMSSSFNPDINANEFHESSKNININHIKAALRKRFRNEQISRLGNNHIIFPAFNEVTFYKLIDLELDKITKKHIDGFGIQLKFKKPFKELIYQEGVFPTQGTRPLFSTIYKMVNTKIPLLLSKNILNALDADTIIFNFVDARVHYEYYKKDCSLYNFEEEVELTLTKLRKPAMDDMQAITAVHESGHAVVSIAALKVIPEYMCSTSSDVSSGGMVVTKIKWKHFSKDEVILHIAVNIAGMTAEKIVFGESKVTRGCQLDLEGATEFATEAIKEYGMGSLAAAINFAGASTKTHYHDLDGTFNAEVKKLLQEGAYLAEILLNQEKILLLQLANYLSDERIMKKEMIEEKVRKYGTDAIKNIVFIEDGNNIYYRDKLKQQVHDSNPDAVYELINISQGSVSLNKAIEKY
ncbi:MAG: hypothetical protein ABI863_09155 [Ginsengibacter sp.]